MRSEGITKNYRLNFKSYAATYLLIAINVLSYILQNDEHSAISLLSDGANFAPFTLDHEPFRLFTSIFLHGNLFHLLVNMYTLHFLGKSIEPKIGLLKFLSLFVFTGIIGSLFSCYLNLFTISVGVSGSLFGLYSFQFFTELIYSKSRKNALIINFIIFLFINLSFTSVLNIDLFTNLGGFLSGILIFYCINYLPNQLATFSIWILPLVFYFIIPKTQVKYYEAYHYMIKKDENIGSALNSNYLKQEEQVEKINVIKNLPDSIKIKFANINNLPEKLQYDTSLINRFINLRAKQINYFLTLLENDSYLYQDSILLINDLLRDAPRPIHVLAFDLAKNDNNSIKINQNGLKQEREYYDDDWNITPYVYKAKYYRIGTKDSTESWHGNVVDYFIDDSPQMKGSYYHGLRQGIFIYYNEDGTYSSAGQFINDKQVGKWEQYYSNNRLANEIRYVGSYSFIENIYDTLGNIMVKNGKGEERAYYPNGQLKFKRTIVGGLNHGFKEGYYRDGRPYYREYHVEGILDYGISYDTLGNLYRYDAFTEWPQPVGGYDKFNEYLEANNKMKLDEINDYVHLKFNVNKDGKIEEIRYLKRLRPDLDLHAKELLLKGPEWQPGKIRGFKKITQEAEVYVGF